MNNRETMDDPVDVFRITLVVVDHDGYREGGIEIVLEDGVLATTVLDVEKRVVDWTDDHPLNFTPTTPEAVRELFAGAPRPSDLEEAGRLSVEEKVKLWDAIHRWAAGNVAAKERAVVEIERMIEGRR